ncbi:hypothetical protein ACFFX0_03290 [Citricoccus parietis]|uniref:Uncharacterized protein n=1 Tax=Citricoccus parietis TaxID=592307 RepID=A0ABV5FU98_9MICC
MVGGVVHADAQDLAGVGDRWQKGDIRGRHTWRVLPRQFRIGISAVDDGAPEALGQVESAGTEIEQFIVLGDSPGRAGTGNFKT